MKSSIAFFFKDARNLQILILSSFLCYGLVNLDWSFEALKFTTVIAASVITQIIFSKIFHGDTRGISSALITAIGLCLLLKTNEIWVSVLAAMLSIAVKFLLKADGKHFFNPSNFGIVVVIILTGEAWVSPGQWGSAAMTMFMIAAAAMLVTIKVKQLGTGLAFIFTLFALEYIRTVLHLGWGMDVLFHKFANGSLLLFTFFMITDPVSTPRHPKARLVWAAAVAGLTFILSSWYFLHAAPIYALFIVAPLTPFINKLFPHKVFQWTNNSNIKPLKTNNHETQIIPGTAVGA
jgi:Na+-transporting NADH:ubiquinone oxidoreductase subunit NqrB